jgi:imidazolonepropionase-like amidohydrolase
MQSTVAATRAAADPALLANARAHRAEMIAGGTTCMETKTGYGLTVHDEVRSAMTAEAAGFDEVSFLGAHVVPPEYEGRRKEYVDEVVIPVAISHQNARCTSRRNDGAPGDFIGDLPVSSFIHPAGRPIEHLHDQGVATTG